MNNLKPCPFCGSERVGYKQYHDTSFYAVTCRSCCTAGSRMTNKDYAIQVWNARPIEDNLQDELKQKHERLRYFENRNTELATENIDLITAEDDLIKAVIAGKDAEIERLKKRNAQLLGLLYKITQRYVFDMLKSDGDELVPLIKQALKGSE